MDGGFVDSGLEFYRFIAVEEVVLNHIVFIKQIRIVVPQSLEYFWAAVPYYERDEQCKK